MILSFLGKPSQMRAQKSFFQNNFALGGANLDSILCIAFDSPKATKSNA